jgi:hypothetical protein
MSSMSMLDRRTFLGASVSLASSSLIAGPLVAIPLAALPEIPALFIWDRRFTTSLSTTSLHTEVAFIEGDVTALWRDRLSALWQSGAASVAGVTEPAALFCLEQLARGAGRTVSMRQPVAGTNAIRWVISPVSPRGFI